MVEAIQFAVRDAAGGVVRGSVAGDGSNFVQMGMGEEVSLHLAPSSVAGYVRQGNDLVMTLVDGRQVVLSGFFNASGEANQLYLSQGGEVVAVDLAQAGDGTLSASYGAADGWDKFSTVDDLRFAETDNLLLAAGPAEDEPAGMAAFVPGLLGMGGAGAGLAGLGLAAAALGGGGGGGNGGNGGGTGGGDTGGGGGNGGGGGGNGGGGDNGGGGSGTTHTPPTVDGTGTSTTISTQTPDKDLDVTGTGHPGDTVRVVIGSLTQTTTITPGGTWSVTFPGTNLPPDGTYVAGVTVTYPNGTTVPLTGPTFFLDLTPPQVEITQGSKSVGDVENLAEYQDGITITGQGEPGASLVITVGGFTQTTTVSANGSWAVTYPTSQLPGGEYELPITIVASDAVGNTTTITDILVVDTIPHPITFDPVTANNVVNAIEAGAGFAISGSSTAGAILTVTVQGISQQVTVGSDGRWTVNFAAGALAPGEYDATIVATTVDAAGNPTSASHTFRVDTVTSVAFGGPVEGDNIVNAIERSDGVILSGTTQAGNSVSVQWNGVTLAATVDASGNWSVSFPASAIPTGATMVATTAMVTATDAAGNSATATRTVQIDTGTSVALVGDVEGDNIINGVEVQDGVRMSGTVEAGNAWVKVKWNGVIMDADVTADGTWSVTFPASSVPGSALMTGSAVQIWTTDAAGNEASAARQLFIDTSTSAAHTGRVEGDDIVNGAEARNGVVLTGTSEAGSTQVLVTWNGVTLPATVATNGDWTVEFPGATIPARATLTDTTVSVVSRDAAGNLSAPATKVVQIDTSTTVAIDAVQAGDNIINAAERRAGVAFTGAAEAGASVRVDYAGQVETVTADASGRWTATFATAKLPTGTDAFDLMVTSTDLAGNVAQDSHSVSFDTDAPGAPRVTSIFSEVPGGLFGIGTAQADYDLSFFRVDATGSATQLAAQESFNSFRNETQFQFQTPIPDGSYLVINTEDAAGNESSTLFIVNNTSSATVDLARAGLAGFDLSAIDLTKAPDARLTITEAQLRELTGPDQTLMVKGDANDTVTATGAVDTGANATVDGQTYSIYTLGEGTKLLLDDDIRTSF